MNQQINELFDRADTQEAVFWERELVISYRFPQTGLTVIGRATCNDVEAFDMEIARQLARGDAEVNLREEPAIVGMLISAELPGLDER